MSSSNRKARPTSEKQALKWFLELKNNDDVSPERWRAFMAWLREKPEHELLFGQFELLWGDFSSVGEAPELLEYAFDVRPPGRENRYWRRWVYGAAAAVVLMVLVTVGFTISFANYSTGPNEQR